MKAKPGVVFSGAQPVVLNAIATADNLSRTMGLGELIVTSVCDGTHKEGSLHYKGLAFDIRTRHLSTEEASRFHRALRVHLGSAWDVLYENPDPNSREDGEHLHAEYDP